MLDVSKFTGDYRESGKWRTAGGTSGDLQGRIIVRVENGQLSFSSDDGHTMTAQPVDGLSQPINLEGTGGGATSSGTLYVGDEAIILEYVANVRGREEHNVDVWTFTDGKATRAGIIRQPERTIWFEAKMIRTA